MTPNWRNRTMWGLSRTRVKNYSKGPLCDLNCASAWRNLEGLLEGLREAITGRIAAS